jgi:hypothetical protein
LFLLCSDRTLTAAPPNPPSPKGNLKITYAFGRNCFHPALHVDSLADASIAVTQFTGEAIVNLPPGAHVIYATACRFDHVIASAAVNVGAPQSQYFVQLGMSTDPEAPSVVEKPAEGGATLYANVALGSIFAVKLVKKHSSGGITNVMPLAAAYAMPQRNVSPTLETTLNLFPQDVAVSLSGGLNVGTETRFAAVHLGTFTVQMLPLTESLAPVRVMVNVVRPAALGGSHNDLDNSIIDAAHERGIPPQILKGQIRQEAGTGFDPQTFRYEPCSADFTYVSRGQTKINTAAYKPFAMDAALDDSDLTPVVDLRNKLYIPDATSPGGRRHITHADHGVTPKQIWLASDNWNDHGQNWSTQSCGAWTKYRAIHGATSFNSFLDEMDKFTAQTPTATSYGLMQVMFDVAVKYDWSVADPLHPGQTTRNPRYLVDTEEALKVKHGGSMFVGSAEDAKRYQLAHPDATTFPSQEEFYDSVKVPLWMYTGGGKSQSDYGITIIDTYQFEYLPTQTGSALP